MGIEFGLETAYCGFHIGNNCLVCLERGLVSLVSGNHLDNNLKEILVQVNFETTVNIRPKSDISVCLFFFFSFQVCILTSVIIYSNQQGS